MTSTKLPHYLRAHRKRLGLSQDELAWLLGCRHGTKVSRYERYVRVPGLDAAFAFQVIFRTTASELFAGHFERIKQGTLKRAQNLLRRLKAHGTQATTAKLTFLEQLCRDLNPTRK